MPIVFCLFWRLTIGYYYDDLAMLVETEEITDVLYLYNANTFFQDTSLAPLLEAAAAEPADGTLENAPAAE